VPRGTTIGLISDTHGLLRPEALDALRGSDRIIHAGDIGSPDILDALRAIAPVIAIRGNIDKDAWAKSLPETEIVEIGDAILYVLHDVHQLDLDPAAAGFRAVISGHSHAPSQEFRAGVLYINPGNAGPRRFRLPITVAKMYVTSTSIEAEFISLTSID
jgi:putative phosphoesterase